MNEVYQKWLEEKHRPWLEFSKGYLKLASLCCQQWIDPKYQWSDENPFVPKPFTESYYKEDLLPGILFNTKHGIELFLKTIINALDLPLDTIHHLKKLFKKVKKEFLKTDWQPITINVNQSVIDDDEIQRLKEEVVDETEKLVRYFYVNKFLDEKLNLGERGDPDNIVFKYPTSKDGELFFGSELYEKVTVEDIKEIRVKIMTLYRHFCDIGYLVVVDKKHQPRKR